MKKLSEEEIKERLEGIDGWEYDGETLLAYFSFPNFIDAMKFVHRVAEIAEELQHHPTILIEYSKVRLSISTHEITGISEKDFDFAARVNFL